MNEKNKKYLNILIVIVILVSLVIALSYFTNRFVKEKGITEQEILEVISNLSSDKLDKPTKGQVEELVGNLSSDKLDKPTSEEIEQIIQDVTK